MWLYVTPGGIPLPFYEGVTATHPATGEYCIVIPKEAQLLGLKLLLLTVIIEQTLLL